MIQKLSTPDRVEVMRLLIEPIARKLKVDAPDPAYALGVIADWAKRYPAHVLAEAAKLVFERRQASAKSSDIEACVKKAAARAEISEQAARSPFLISGMPEWEAAYQEVLRLHGRDIAVMEFNGVKIRKDRLAKLGVDVSKLGGVPA